MAILNRLTAILLYCDSTFFGFSLQSFWRFQARDSGNCAIRDSRFCAAKVLMQKQNVMKRLKFIDDVICGCGGLMSSWLASKPGLKTAWLCYHVKSWAYSGRISCQEVRRS